MAELAKQDTELDCTNKLRGVWLVKVPKYVAESWEKVGSKVDAAKLKIEKKVQEVRDWKKAKALIKMELKTYFSLKIDDLAEIIGGKPNVSMTLSDAAMAAIVNKEQGVVPREYKLAVGTLSAQTIAVFSQPNAPKPTDKDGKDKDGDEDLDSSDGDDEEEMARKKKKKKRKLQQQQQQQSKKVILEGRVVQRAECRPVADVAYMKHKAQMIRDSSKPTRTAIQLDKAVQSYKPIAVHKHDVEFERFKKTEVKKARGEKDKVMEAIFAAFEKHQCITNQPMAFLKELLKEIGIYNAKAPHKNTWELKPEYRHYKPKDSDEDDDD